MRRKTKAILLLPCFALLSGLIISSCKKKDETPEPQDSFDKSGMLSNIGENIILPSYQSLKTNMDAFQLSASVFVASPTLSNLSDLRIKYQAAYISYQHCSAFEFGPGEAQVIRSNFNTFPCDTVQVNTNISSGVYDLDAAANLDAKGFPAMDFLIYGANMNDGYILSLYTTSASAVNAKNYMTALTNELKLKTDAVVTGWDPAAGNYLDAFRSNTGSDVGGSIGQLVNQLNFDLEILKNARIGIPLGKQTLGIPLPEKVEAVYAQYSLALAAEHLNTIENIYLGRSTDGADGLGLDDYLSHVGASYGAGSLNDAIKNRITSAKAKLALIPGPLSYDVVNNAPLVDAAYAELQQLVVLMKVDMPSALGVLITYVDNDGD